MVTNWSEFRPTQAKLVVLGGDGALHVLGRAAPEVALQAGPHDQAQFVETISNGAQLLLDGGEPRCGGPKGSLMALKA